MKGVSVYPRQKKIELDDKYLDALFRNDPLPFKKLFLFLKELQTIYNYSIQSVIMKAKNEPVEEGTAEITQEVHESNEPLISVEILDKKYVQLKPEIVKYCKYAEAVKIEDENSLKVAENNSGLINDALKAIEKIRKMIKEPYLETSKLIDNHAKQLSDPLTKAKDTVNVEITNYKKVQAAALRAEMEKKEKEIARIADEKAAEVERMSRVEKQLISRLYGGSWINAAGKEFSSEGCKTPADCDTLKSIMESKVPKADEFTHIQADYKDMLKRMRKINAEHKTNLIESSSESVHISSAALERIDAAKSEAGIQAEEAKAELSTAIIQEARKEMKEQAAEVADASKGIRTKLCFEVANIKDVPEEFLILNDIAVRAWAGENKELIKAKVKTNDNIINGIKFWVEQKFAAS